MRATLTSELIQAVIGALERDRPELFGAFTSAFKAEVGLPWSKNEPAPAQISKFDTTEIHYAVSVANLSAKITQAGVEIVGNAAAKFRKRSREGAEDRQFNMPLKVVAAFEDPLGTGTHHRLRYRDLLLTGLMPAAVNQVVSWYLAIQMNDASEPNSGVPKELKPKGIGTIKLGRPKFETGRLVIDGSLS